MAICFFLNQVANKYVTRLCNDLIYQTKQQTVHYYVAENLFFQDKHRNQKLKTELHTEQEKEDASLYTYKSILI